MRQLLALLSCAVCLAIAGCDAGGVLEGDSEPVTKRDMVGKYEVQWKRNLGTETLTLIQNGTFEQVFMPANGRAAKNSGTWNVTKRMNGEPELHLHHYVCYVKHFPDHSLVVSPRPEEDSMLIFKKEGSVSLTVDIDTGFGYSKKK